MGTTTKSFFNLMLSVICLACSALRVGAATYYIRLDGGSSLQCNGLADAAYPGAGSQQPCAWNHLFWAVDDLYVSPSWRISGGDTIVIHPGSYMLGYGAPNTETCDPDAAFACCLPPLPGGPDVDHPTRILGFGWEQGCANPPELWGTERVEQILDLSNTVNAVVACLDITDHSGCVEFHSNPEVACTRDVFPFGSWASVGILAVNSANVKLQRLDIHGLASAGIWAGRLTDWQLQHVRLAGNGWVGWDGDVYGDDSNSGIISFQNVVVEWNGCAETYPGMNPDHCWGQDAGGYGDGVGTGNTGGHWVIEDSTFCCNVSDGLDLLYVGRAAGQPSSIEIKRTVAHSNGGNQIKTNGPAGIENSLLVGNCGYFEGKPFAQEMTNHCRAGGAALSLSVAQGDAVSLVNSTIAGQGDCLCTFECDADYSSCNGSEVLILQNNIFRGYQDFFDAEDRACTIWFDQDNFYTTQMDYNVLFEAKIGQFVPIGPHDIEQDPLLVNDSLDNFDGRLRSQASPAVDSGLAVGSLGGLIPDHDLGMAPRPQGGGVDRGAYEYRQGGIGIGVFRSGEGLFFLKNSISSGYADAVINFGLPGDNPVVGDWDGDGIDTIGVQRNGLFLLRNSNAAGTADLAFCYGDSGDIPVAGDWDGDGVGTIGVYRNGMFYLRNSNSTGTADLAFPFGIAGDLPMAGDWTGKGHDTVGVFRPANATVYLKNDNSAGFADIILAFGIPGDRPTSADWDENGTDSIGVYRDGHFYLRNTNASGFADLSLTFGIAGDVPFSGKWK